MQSKSAELSGAIRPRRRTDRVGLATGPREPARGHKFTRGNDFNRLTALSRNSRRIPSLPGEDAQAPQSLFISIISFPTPKRPKTDETEGIFRHAKRKRFAMRVLSH